ncbi:Urease accessory protein UreF [Serratia fonticola]|nr:Urease accessory protein UreF [Serratia fonticola]
MTMTMSTLTPTRRVTVMDNDVSLINLLRVMQFGDSVFPIGAFSFSNGVESAVQVGLVHDVASLRQFVETSLHQASRCDAVGLAHAHRAFNANDTNALLAIDREILNRKLNEESRTMAQRMGKKLAEVATKTLDSALLTEWLGQIKAGSTPGTLPVSQAIVMGVQGIGISETLAMHCYGVVMTILSAAQRLMRITHYDSQRILHDIIPLMPELCRFSAHAGLDDMSSHVPVIDILAAVHVDAHVRLFMN